MKHRSTILMLVLFGLIILATRTKAQCYAPNFLATIAYAQKSGGGVEIGYWPQDFSLGGFLGFGLQQIVQKDKAGNWSAEARTQVYIRPQLRLNRYVYLIGVAGAHQFDEGYLAAGVRVSIPVSGRGDAYRFAVVTDGMYGTEGAMVSVGVGFSLEK